MIPSGQVTSLTLRSPNFTILPLGHAAGSFIPDDEIRFSVDSKKQKFEGQNITKWLMIFCKKKLNIKYSPKHITITIPSDRPSLQRCYHTCVESQLWLCSPGGLKEHWRSMKTGSAMVMMHPQWIWYHDGYIYVYLKFITQPWLPIRPWSAAPNMVECTPRGFHRLRREFR